MKNILDNIDQIPSNETDYRKWAFRFLIYTIIVNIVVFFLTINYMGNNVIFDILNNTLIVLGTICCYLSFLNKEPKDFKFKFSTIGFSILIIFTIISILTTL
jgi:hypothetical protein